jgi:hypothetical protein
MLQIGTIGAIACLVGIGVTFYSWEETMNDDLSLVSVDDSSALPETGESQVIIARTGDDLHVRIFDDNGNRAVDKSEDVLSGGQTISELKELLKTDPLPDISQWKKEERQEVIQKAAAVSGRTHVMLIVLMCTFVAFFAFSLGPIKFIFASEVFPTNIRSHAMSIAILTMWLTDTLVGQFTPALREGIGPSGTFLIFAAILVPQVFMVWKFMPETAGRSLEEIEQTYYGAES